MNRHSLLPAARALYVLLLLALIGSLVFGWWEHFDGSYAYDDVVDFGSAYWPMNLLLFGPSYVVTFTALAFFVAVLGRGRALWLALAGAVVMALSGTLFAIAATAEVLPFDWAVNHGLLPGGDAEATFALYDDFLDSWWSTWVFPAMIGIAVGTLVAVVGAVVSGGLRWWWILVTVAVLVLQAAAPLGSVLGDVSAVLQCLLCGWLGWLGLRALGHGE